MRSRRPKVSLTVEEMVKSFDAVEITRKIRDAYHERLKDASSEKRVRFYKRKAQALATRDAELEDESDEDRASS